MQQKSGLQEAETLTVPDLGVIHRVGLGHLVERVLAHTASLSEVLMTSERAVNVLLDARLPPTLLAERTGTVRSEERSTLL